MRVYFVILVVLVVALASARPLMFFPSVEDGSFENGWNGEIAIDEWYKKDDAGSTSAGITPMEFTWIASHTLDSDTRMGVITFFDNDGGGKITYEAIADRCVPDPSFGQLDPTQFSWDYSWGKDGDGSFVSAKMVVQNRETGLFCTFVYLAEPGATVAGVWHDVVIDQDTERWVFPNCFWIRVLGDATDDANPGPMDVRFINNGNMATLDVLNNGMMELFARLPSPPPPPMRPEFTDWPDVDGTTRSIAQWLDLTTPLDDFIGMGAPNVNPLAYGLTNGGTSLPEVVFLQFGVGTSASVKSTYLDRTELRLGGVLAQQSEFNTMGPTPLATPEEIDDCTRTPRCTISPMKKREFNHIRGFRNQEFSMEDRPNGVFNLLSDDHCQVNARLGKKSHNSKSHVTQLGFRVGDEKVLIGCDDRSHDIVVELNGQSLISSFSDASFKKKLSSSSGFISRDDSGVFAVAFPLYYFKISVVKSSTPLCHVGFSVKHWHIDPDSPPHGVLGVTMQDDDHNARSMASTLLTGHWKDFRVSDMFSSDFKHNQYNTTASVSDLNVLQFFAKRSVFVSETV